jgi:hypothetical protein
MYKRNRETREKSYELNKADSPANFDVMPSSTVTLGPYSIFEMFYEL